MPEKNIDLDCDQRYFKQYSTLTDLTRKAAYHQGDIDHFLKQLCKSAAEALEVERVSVWRYNADRTFLCCYCLYERSRDICSSGAQIPAASCAKYIEAWALSDVIDVHDAQRDERTRDFSDSYLSKHQISSMLDAPVRRDGMLDGVVCHEHVGPLRQWTPGEKTFAVSIANLVSLMLDQWERKQAESLLRQKELQFLNLVDSVEGIVWEADGNTFQFSFVSKQAERLLGYPVSQWLEDRHFWAAHVHPDDRDTAITYCVAATTERRDHQFEYRMIAADGRVVWLRDLVTIVPSTGPGVQLRGIMVDITEQKRADEALRRSQANVAALVENTTASVWSVDKQYRFITFNTAFKKMLVEYIGKEPRPGCSISEVATPEDLEQWKLLYDRALRGEHFSIAYERTLQGVVRNFEVSFNPILDGEEITGVSVFCNDVTERHRLESQLLQAQKMESVGRLAGGIAHDFNNILTVIQGYAGLLLGREAEPGPDPAQEIVLAAERASRLTQKLLTFSRQQSMELRPIELNEVITQFAKMLHRLLNADIQLEILCTDGPLWVLGDQGMLEQVILNLAINARDAMPMGGRLRIKTGRCRGGATQAGCCPDVQKNGEFACLTVADTGCGITKEHLSQIFEPFFTTKETGKGTGLGLAIVYGVVKQHKGWIEVDSTPGEGTHFQIVLPLEMPAVTAPLPAHKPPPARGREKILLVEDEQAVRFLARTILERMGYTVIEAANGPEALQSWKSCKESIDLLITDMVMPGGLNGRDLAEQLRQDCPHLKVLFTSGYSADVLTSRGSKEEDRFFLQKPYNASKLLSIVRERLQAQE